MDGSGSQRPIKIISQGPPPATVSVLEGAGSPTIPFIGSIATVVCEVTALPRSETPAVFTWQEAWRTEAWKYDTQTQHISQRHSVSVAVCLHIKHTVMCKHVYTIHLFTFTTKCVLLAAGYPTLVYRLQHHYNSLPITLLGTP